MKWLSRQFITGVFTVMTAFAGAYAATSSSAPHASSPAEEMSASDLAEQAADAFATGDFSRAIELYGQLRPRLPDAAEVPFNAGVAAYRAGDMDAAAEFFRNALAEGRTPELQSQAAESLGHVTTQRVFDGDSPRAAQPQFNEKLDSAIRDMRDVFRHFRNRLRSNPADDTARRNAERAQRQLQRLEQVRQQLQQQQSQQQQDESQQQQDEQNQQRQQDQQNQQQQQQDQSQQPQNQQDQSQQQQQQQSQEQQPQEQQQAQQSGTEDQSESSGAASESADQEQSQEQPSARNARQDSERMTEDEAERILQRVRDRNRQREQQRAARQQRASGRVDKDW
jgi:Ca-activated chloride channel family protein